MTLQDQSDHPMEEDEEEQIQPAATWDGDYRQEASEDETPASEWNKHSSETGETYYVNVVSGETSWENPDSPQQDQENDWVEAHTKEEPIDDKITYPYDGTETPVHTDVERLAADASLEEEFPAATEEIFNEDIAEEPGVLGLSLEQRVGCVDQQGGFSSGGAGVGEVAQELVGDAVGTMRLASDTGHTPDFSNTTTSPVFLEQGSNFTATPNDTEEGVEWLELQDPDQGALYYFAPHSGEVRWEAPTKTTAHIRHCDSDAVLDEVVSLRPAARSHQARARVALMKEQKLQSEGSRSIDDEENQDKSLLNEGETKVCFNETEGEALHHQIHEPQWVEVYDPVTQHQYYYSPRTNTTRWDVSELLGSSIDSHKAAAATSIQSMFRGRAAREQVQELRENTPQHNQLQPIQEVSLIESEFEAVCRREMIKEELLQLSGGDRFWGLDIHDSEVLQLHIEEELMAKGVSTISQQYPRMYTPQQEMLTANINLSDYLAFEEDDEKVDTERLQRELKEEFEAREAMFREEAQQCQNADSFWGIQAEESRQATANVAMALEEEASRRFAENALEQALSMAWEEEVQQSVANELATRGGQEQRMQERYLSWFYGQCISVDELLDYRWPTKLQQERLEETPSPVKSRQSPVVQAPLYSFGSATPFPLDDLVVQERLDNGDLRYGLRSILTVHHQHSRGTNGTRFEITQATPECSFDEITATEMLKNSMTTSFSCELGQNSNGGSLNGYQDNLNGLGGATYLEDGASCSSVNYRRSEMPDPHIPARFNGVPYKPNQMSPTREILSGDHRKLNQLPSLAKSKLTMEVSKLRQLQKAKAKARAKSKHSGSISPQSFSNGNNFASDKDREIDDCEKQTNDVNSTEASGDNGRHTQFIRQEHDVLSQLFALMDVDGSGTVNQAEMQWALQRDEEINALAKTSPLLRVLLKQRSRLETLFSSLDMDTQSSCRGDSRNELSLEEFLARSEHCHNQLVAEGLLQLDSVFAVAAPPHPEGISRGGQFGAAGSAYSDQSDKEAETNTIRRVFTLLDIDQNGILDVAEVREALYDSAATTPKSATRVNGSGKISRELHDLVKSSRALQPMLHQELFMTAFSKFEPLDPHGICEEEFVAFCLEIAQVAAVNNMT